MIKCPACKDGSCNETVNEKVIQLYCIDCSHESEQPNNRPKIVKTAPEPTPPPSKKTSKHWTDKQ